MLLWIVNYNVNLISFKFLFFKVLNIIIVIVFPNVMTANLFYYIRYLIIEIP